MALTQLIVPSGLQDREVKVKIIQDTQIGMNGKGVPIFAGSILNVSAYDAALLFASLKAEKADSEDKEHLVDNPHRAIENAFKNQNRSSAPERK